MSEPEPVPRRSGAGPAPGPLVGSPGAQGSGSRCTVAARTPIGSPGAACWSLAKVWPGLCVPLARATFCFLVPGVVAIISQHRVS